MVNISQVIREIEEIFAEQRAEIVVVSAEAWQNRDDKTLVEKVKALLAKEEELMGWMGIGGCATTYGRVTAFREILEIAEDKG